jgi:hypothetical protein
MNNETWDGFGYVTYGERNGWDDFGATPIEET